MAVEIAGIGWQQLYTQMRRAPGFLQRFFTLKPGGIFNGKKVQIDIERYGEDVAVVVKHCTGPNLNDFNQWTTKEFEPPEYSEGFPLDVCDLVNRLQGVDPYASANQGYTAKLMQKVTTGFMLVDAMIQRALELQASQILQTGTLSLTDKQGNVVYELDFKPKATHFPTVGTAWSNPAADALGDLASLAEVIRADGKIDPEILIFGTVAFKNFKNNTAVQAELDNRRINTGEINPEMRDSGATFQGFIWVGDYQMQMWTYPETYTHPQTGLPTKYIEDDKVVMMSSNTRLDVTSARVPRLNSVDPRLEGMLPDRITQTGRAGYDVSPYIWATPNGRVITGELESRPLLIPVQIDGFGCLDTNP